MPTTDLFIKLNIVCSKTINVVSTLPVAFKGFNYLGSIKPFYVF